MINHEHNATTPGETPTEYLLDRCVVKDGIDNPKLAWQINAAERLSSHIALAGDSAENVARHPEFEAFSNVIAELVAGFTIDELQRLPDPERAPLLLGQICYEIRHARISSIITLSEEVVLQHSETLRLWRREYKREDWRTLLDNYNQREYFERGGVLKFLADQPTTNSSCLNMVLARALNRGILKDTDFEARIALESYTLKDQMAAIYPRSPDLGRAQERTLARAIVRIVHRNKAQVMFHADYGPKPQNGYGEGPAYETGHPSLASISPESEPQLLECLRGIFKRQGNPEVCEADMFLNTFDRIQRLVKELGDNKFPTFLGSLDSLTEKQLDSITMLAAEIEGRLGKYRMQELVGKLPLYPSEEVLARFAQPSSRTRQAATATAQIAGYTLTVEHTANTSLAKGESRESDGEYREALDIKAVGQRNSGPGEHFSRGVSYGDQLNHPLQTISELVYLMRQAMQGEGKIIEFTLDALRKNTEGSQQVVTFVTRFEPKGRTNGSLARTILSRLPSWKVNAIVPYAHDLPTDPVLLKNPNFSATVCSNLRDGATVMRMTEGSTVLYLSGGSKTSTSVSSATTWGQKVRITLSKIKEFVDLNLRGIDSPILIPEKALEGKIVLHPGPAAGELPAGALTKGKVPSYRAVMRLKVFVGLAGYFLSREAEELGKS